MLLHDARRASRVDDAGDLVPLEDQDRSAWDRAQIAEAVAVLDRRCAAAGPASTRCRPPSRRCTPRRPTRRRPTGRRSPRCTRELARLAPGPVVELNRAVAVAMADGPAAGWRWSTTSPPTVRSPTTTCCRRPGPTCCDARPPRRGGGCLPPGARPGHHRGRAPLPDPTPARGVRRVGIMAGWVSTG